MNQKTFWIEELLKQLKPYDNYTKFLKEVPAALSANHFYWLALKAAGTSITS